MSNISLALTIFYQFLKGFILGYEGYQGVCQEDPLTLYRGGPMFIKRTGEAVRAKDLKF